MRNNKGKITRRTFIKTSSAVGVGVALNKLWTFGGPPEKTGPRFSGSLKMRTLGRTGLKVTELSFGGIQIGESALLDEAIDKGINLIHTSQGYGRGRSIQEFGKVMKTKRDKVYLCLKSMPEMDRVEKALKNLNTDTIDILVPGMHDVDTITRPGLEEGFERLKKDGKIRFSGFACHKNEVDVMRKAIALGFFDVMLVRYNLDNKDKLDEVLADAKEKQNMGFMAMKVVKELNEKKKYDRIPDAIRETIRNPNVDSLLIGMANFDELRMNLAALSV